MISIQFGIHNGLRRAAGACAACLLAVALCGCVTNSKTPRAASSSAIDELNLLGLPVAVNLDRRPGADGVVVKLFATSRSSPRAMPLRSGTLELIAYEGTPSPAALPMPFHRWTFTPAELAHNEFTTVLGTGYRLVLSWMPRSLPSDRVTIIARYHPHKAEPVTSAPSSITASAY
ncbi:MAG: hypothetical protein KA191_03415 [Verrucomicrobia bacterium]|jgi:hypothetical protein|nr:hypothetical protein [Verrucomicrobiota bacterium]OQC66755.1 MAG: hypothetical protein BWX48_01341 [Verrucomicrobia bacterium ADurb.Bin006]MDI9381586.1 hypothetical protein [Verrucomicrobiota bacterium]HNU98348.1 hypothetical protein [Verrucomicrobiota bacterium]HOA61192.1 hypothetical protein [Verrucomicrobiota bacterium]